MGLPSSGAISIGGVHNELQVATYSLRALSAELGKTSPDALTEFYGYSLPTATINMSQNIGQLYDGCSMSMDSFGHFESTDPNGGYQGPYNGSFTSNTERGANAGTFLTFGGSSSATVRGKSSVSVTAFGHGYGACPCQPMYVYINVNGVRRANTNATCGYVQIGYSFTASPGSTHNVEIGVYYGSV
jgi:hypothetical protein